ncbi:MAG: hypothetical protein ACSHYA_10455 [Opitutaceae bacterium]
MSRIPHFLALLIALFFTAQCGFAQSNRMLGAISKKNSGSLDKKVEKKLWGTKQNTGLMNKTFPIGQWDKHFSSVGSKRSPINDKDAKDKKIFKTDKKEFPIKEFDMASWNQKLSDLQKNAQISTDSTARDIAERQLYYMMLQDTRKYEEMGVELSLSDINKYQFRRNRSSGEVPVEKVGE